MMEQRQVGGLWVVYVEYITLAVCFWGKASLLGLAYSVMIPSHPAANSKVIIIIVSMMLQWSRINTHFHMWQECCITIEVIASDWCFSKMHPAVYFLLFAVNCCKCIKPNLHHRITVKQQKRVGRKVLQQRKNILQVHRTDDRKKTIQYIYMMPTPSARNKSFDSAPDFKVVSCRTSHRQPIIFLLCALFENTLASAPPNRLLVW